jgi:hypothetical protein
MKEGGVALILESSSERAALMYQRLPQPISNVAFWVKTVSECKQVIQDYRESLFLVSLEHDLERPYMNSKSETSGMEIVRFLEKIGSLNFKDCLFVVHSWNEIAGEIMLKRLLNAGYPTIWRPYGE